MAPNAYNITVLDQSPTVVYSPYRDGPLDSSWRIIYSNSPESTYDATHNNENLSSGTSLHSTTLSGASLKIDFKGTAIYLYGTGSADAYTTSLDGKDTSGSPSDDLLASYTGLDYASHSLVLTTTQNSQLNFTSALLTVGIGEAGASINKTSIDAVNVASDGSSSLNSYFTTFGNGPFSTDHDATGYPRIDTTGDGSKIMFEFSSASALFVYGTTNYDHEIYSVSLNPTAGVSTSSRTFNDTSRWFAYDNLVYWETDLNRSLTYQVTFMNLAEGKYMDIHSVCFIVVGATMCD
ncbi:hypothetical protein CPB85DRAFT_1291849 [Mucidula mucida]|nr:hypothetical protein CPB85DRAFT_1291849 [Mucidula mucida]